jgi:hypothetical protein
MATQADVEAELGRTLSAEEAAKVSTALESASDYVRAETGRKWAAGTFTVTRRPRSGKVRLDSPASIASVSTIDETGTASTVDAGTYALRGGTVYGLSYACEYEITYVSDGTVPDELRRVVAAMVARDLTEDRPQGATSYSTTKGPFSESATFDEPMDSVEPTKAERRILDRFAARSRMGTLSLL